MQLVMAGKITRTVTATLCKTLEALAAKPELTPEEGTECAELIAEIERRVPAAKRAVADLYETNPDATRADHIRVLVAKYRADRAARWESRGRGPGAQ